MFDFMGKGERNMINSGNKFSVTQLSVSNILSNINSGSIAIPDIQRPFVWQGSQVRDLVDSLYKGYPTGYLIISQNPSIKLKNGGSAIGKQVIIDGQQRITALMTSIAGQEILTSNFELKRIKIAFNPIAKDGEQCFAVSTPAHDKSSIWISDISEVFQEVLPLSFIQEYLEKNPNIDRSTVENSVSKLLAIQQCQLGVITLNADLDINEVTEIFVRINSKGARLNEADFAMSKLAANETYGGNIIRKAIDYFCHLGFDPSFYNRFISKDNEFMNSQFATKIKWFTDKQDCIYKPDYNDMLRVSLMHIFGRGKLGDLVSLLSGRDFTDRNFKEEIMEDSFKKLELGITNFINQHNFDQFILAITSAGFISSKLLNSKMTLDFAYTLYLILQKDQTIPKTQIKSYIQKWFVLSTLTGRYTFSPESQMDRDLRNINLKGFLVFFEETEKALLSDTFWNIALVQNLETSSISSPYFNVFLASQIFSGDKSFLSNTFRVSELISIAGDIHHIFPKNYLKKNGISNKTYYNQVANYTYLDTNINKYISDRAPKDYLNEVLSDIDSKSDSIGKIRDKKSFLESLDINCVPHDITDMDATNYSQFLLQRRKLMARKIKNYYYSL